MNRNFSNRRSGHLAGLVALLAGSALSASGCGTGSTPAAAAPAPVISILSPRAGDSVAWAADADKTIPVAFSVQNFALAAPGTCPSSSAGSLGNSYATSGDPLGCGHVHLLIDGAAGGTPYNNAGAQSPLAAKLAALGAAAPGVHTIVLELHNDDHSSVLADGAIVSASVTFAAGPPGSSAPTLSISSPAPDATVSLGADADKSVPIAFSVQSFRLAAPGTCGGDTACGHVHVLVDGDSGGVPYNNAGAASPIDAKFVRLTTATGSHSVRLELRSDDHSPVLSSGQPVGAQVSIATTSAGGSTSPRIDIVSPATGSTVSLDTAKQLPVEVSLENFTLAAPGSCGGAAKCGHFHILLDGVYAGQAAANPVDVSFASIESPAGAHAIVLELHDDAHAPVLVDHEVVKRSVNVTVN